MIYSDFVGGKVVKATAERNQDFLLKMLDMDAGARYFGEIYRKGQCTLFGTNVIARSLYDAGGAIG
jgi:hypothetical protein